MPKAKTHVKIYNRCAIVLVAAPSRRCHREKPDGGGRDGTRKFGDTGLQKILRAIPLEAHESADQHVKTLIQVEELDAKELGRQSTQEECAESDSGATWQSGRFRLLFRSLSGEPVSPIQVLPLQLKPGTAHGATWQSGEKLARSGGRV